MALETSLTRKNLSSINLLRSIAILSVLLFHFFSGFFPFGYLGVDIFFIVSGFLVSQQISRQISSGAKGFNIVFEFWKKRLVRIFPSLLLTVFIAVLLTFIYGNYKLLKQVSIETIASLQGILNFQLNKSSGYFEISSQSKPLLHLWSLSIEMQFYFIAPLLYFLYCFKRKIFIVGSLISFALLIGFNTFNLSYYSSLIRLLQFFLGIGVFLTLNTSWFRFKGNKLSFYLGSAFLVIFISNPYFSITWSPSLALCFSLYVSILLYVGVISDYLPNRRIKFVVDHIGQSTLSIYLFHWILLVFFKLYVTQDLTFLSSLLLFLLAIVLGLLGRQFVERRFAVETPYVFHKIVLGIVSIIFLSTNFIYGNFLSENLRVSRNLYNATNFDGSIYSQQSCSFLINEKLLKNFCTEWNYLSYDKTVLVWGDSFSNSWLPAFLKHSKENTRVIQVSHAACPPILGVIRVDESFASEWCNSGVLQSELVSNLNDMGLSEIFLIARWSLYTEGLFKDGNLAETSYIFDPKDTSRTIKSAKLAFKKFLPTTVHELSQIAPVTIFLETPTMPRDLSLIRIGQNPFILRDDYLRFTKVSRSTIQKIEGPNIRIFDPVSKVCGPIFCSSFRNSLPLYSDDAHPTLVLLDLFSAELNIWLKQHEKLRFDSNL